MARVPYTGQYKMFDTGSEGNPNRTSIMGSQKHNALDSVDGNTNFSHNIADAQVPLFDPLYAGDIESLNDISGSLQWRGYPVDVDCYTCNFEEITDPSIKNITYSCSAFDPQVSFNVVLSGTTSATNGAVTKQVSIGNTVTGNISNVTTPPEQFVGWSYSDDGSTGILSTSTSYTHTVEEDITIYALVRLSDAIGVDFCYYPSLSLNTICGSCNTTKTVYFDRDLYETNPIEDLIWYENVGLTIKSDQGYYRKKTTYTYQSWFREKTRTVIDDTIYFVSGSGYPTPGEANVFDTCGEFIYCS